MKNIFIILFLFTNALIFGQNKLKTETIEFPCEKLKNIDSKINCSSEYVFRADSILLAIYGKVKSSIYDSYKKIEDSNVKDSIKSIAEENFKIKKQIIKNAFNSFLKYQDLYQELLSKEYEKEILKKYFINKQMYLFIINETISWKNLEKIFCEMELNKKPSK